MEFYVVPGGPFTLTTRFAILTHLTNGLVVALAASQPAMYNRSKWMGSDLAIDDIAIIECVHRLLSTTYARYCSSYLGGEAAGRVLRLGTAMAHYDRVVSAGCDHDGPDTDGDQGGQGAPAGHVHDAAVAHAGHDEEQGARVADESSEYARLNAIDRKQAMKFLLDGSLGSLMLIRWLMEPLRRHFVCQFARASESWPLRQKAALAKALKDGRPSTPKLRVVEAASGEEDSKFFEQIRLLFERTEIWAIMPPSHHTVSARAKAFRCLSRMGCAFMKLLASRHQKFPYQVFRLLVAPHLAAEFRAVSDCMLDEWTKWLKRSWPTLEGEELTQVLYTVAILLRMDISHIEARHASVRRMLTIRSVQTNPASLDSLSAQWLFQQHRTAGQRFAERAPRPHTATGKKRNANVLETAPKRRVALPTRSKRTWSQSHGRGGGAWRAWVRRHTAGAKKEDVDFKELAANYQHAKETQSPIYRECLRVGRIATQVGKLTGKHGFGVSAKAARRAKQPLARLHQMLTNQMPETDYGTEAIGVATRSIAVGVNVPQMMSVARLDQRLTASKAAGQDRQQRVELKEYERTTGADFVRAFQRAHPDLAGLPLACEPSVVGRHLRADLPTITDVEKAVSWANRHAHASGLAARLETQWGELHHTVSDADDGRSGRPDAASTESKCIEAGICLCSEDGQKLGKRANKFLNYIKLLCNARRGFRADLAHGFIVVRLFGWPSDYEAFFRDDSGIIDIWLHIGLMYWPPYEPTFMVVEPVGHAEVSGEGPGGGRGDRLFVRSAQRFEMLYPAFARMVNSDVISASVYRLEDVDRPIAAFSAQPVPIVPLPDFEEPVQFWPRLNRRRRARRAPDQPDGSDGQDDDAAAVEDADEVDGDAGADGAEDEQRPCEEEDAPPQFVELLNPLLDAYDQPVRIPFAAAAVRADPMEPPRVPEGNDDGAAAPDGEQRAARDAPAARVPYRERYDNTVFLDSGLITYYESNNAFEARCFLHRRRCKMSRVAFQPGVDYSRRRDRKKGRPLGFLAAWLGVGPGCGSKDVHCSHANVRHIAGPHGFALRREARAALAALPGAEVLFERERNALGDEEEEPAIVYSTRGG